MGDKQQLAANKAAETVGLEFDAGLAAVDGRLLGRKRT
jgi:hypothetical protein